MQFKPGDKVYNFIDKSKYKFEICTVKNINNNEITIQSKNGDIEIFSIRETIRKLKRCYQ